MPLKQVHYDYLVVGAGLFGCTVARILTDAGKKVLVVEKRHVPGGNVTTHVEEGIVLHDYGPHIFHTSFEDVWSFVNKYAEFYPFVNSPLANYEGELYHLPFNMNTFHELWGVTTAEEAKAKIAEEVAKENIGEPKNLEEQAIKLVGRTVYEKLVKGYTSKQWGRPCNELPSFIIKRLPLRFEYDNNYYSDKYQGLPKGGFSVLIDNLLKGIDVRLDTDFFDSKDGLLKIAKNVIYSGPIDAYFDYCFGHLEYRSLKFETVKKDVDHYQSCAVMNFTSNKVPYTRINEHKNFDPYCGNHHSTFLTYEYPAVYNGSNEAYYPINNDANGQIYEKYAQKASELESNVFFGGRLATYKYFDMDDTIKAAFDLVDKLLNR
jgi:UDP-galactopyranose mutase